HLSGLRFLSCLRFGSAGYASSAACDPVARAGASRRPREQAHRKWQYFPEGAAAYLTGLCIVSRLRSRHAAGK
ncbi:hypothetical protein, partial [Klebsiella sp. ME-303]|uniref:hypothetical protein n=1 Tax=Klebsiella sp. ME-303 TaxID=2600607 RepID=UPI001C98C54C